jgi:hypothetical protein
MSDLNRLRSERPWWELRSRELAERYDFDPKALLDAVDDPDGISDEQFDLVFRAVQFCRLESASRGGTTDGRQPATVIDEQSEVE